MDEGVDWYISFFSRKYISNLLVHLSSIKGVCISVGVGVRTLAASRGGHSRRDPPLRGDSIIAGRVGGVL